MQRRFFHTFDTLRFLAFFKVFLLHIPIAGFPIFSYLKAGGGIGVVFFFVLSGFLISYIIFHEKESTGKFNLYHFYLRRILRIWPLYFLMILFAFATPYILSIVKINSSPEGYEPAWWMSCLFLENYKMLFTGMEPNVSPLGVMWSLCIEEHFYLLWGLSFLFIKLKHVPIFLGISALASIIANGIFHYQNWQTIEISTNLIYFCAGAIPAYLLATKKEAFEEKINRIPIFLKALMLLVCLFFVIVSPHTSNDWRWLYEPIVFSVLFACLICIVIPAENYFKVSDSNILSRLGVWTYGLYLYHTIVINLFYQLSLRFQINLSQFLPAILFFMASLATTIVISAFSYYLFENRFLKLKKYFY